MSNQVCPTCKGKKQYYRRCFPTVLSGWIDCGTCNATGEIDEQKAALIEMGKDIKAKRIELRVLTRDIAAANNFTLKEWTDIERGDSTLELSYRARAIVEALEYKSKTVYDVIVHESASQMSRMSFNNKSQAELHRDKLKEKARQLNTIIFVEIKERIETTLNLEVGK